MQRTSTRLIAALLVAGTAPAAIAAVPLGEVAGADISFEGLLQSDHYWYDDGLADLDGDPGDGSGSDHGVRRAELVLKGKGERVDWVAGYDAEAESWLDVNARLRFGAGDRQFLRLGQFKVPHGLEELSSGKNNDFISKAMTTNTFATGRRLGAAWGIGEDDWSITASAFGRELTSGGDHGSGYAVRGTWAPLNTDAGLFHLGLSHVDRDTDADELRLRTRPQADFAAVRLVDTGTFRDADRIATTGAEAMWVAGPLKLQAEVVRAQVDRLGAAGYSAHGGYLSALYNLTGQSWGYKDGVPTTSLPGDTPGGLWQLALRHDRMDLDDRGVDGGRMDALTAGVNWYWRDNAKLMVDYIMVDSERGGRGDDPDIVAARLQLHW